MNLLVGLLRTICGIFESRGWAHFDPSYVVLKLTDFRSFHHEVNGSGYARSHEVHDSDSGECFPVYDARDHLAIVRLPVLLWSAYSRKKQPVGLDNM